MQAKDIYDNLIARGFTMAVKDDGLFVSPRASLTPQDADEIRARKPELTWLALAQAEGLQAEVDQYGVRLTLRMPDALYVAIANARRETFLAMKKRGAVQTEED